MKTIKIGSLPGRIQELAVENGTTIAQAIEIAGLDVTGKEVKVDGNTELDLNAPVESANIILLVTKIKGNSPSVKVGQLPGRIEEFAIEEGTTVAEAIELAGLDASGKDVKGDGVTITDLNESASQYGIILLVVRVKGNSSSVKVGQLPGRIEEYAIEDNTTVAEVIALAGLETQGKEVKGDGTTITDLSVKASDFNVILLVMLVKGNS